MKNLIFLIFLIATIPNIAHAHGIEQVTPYVGLSALIVGIIGGVVCTLLKKSFRGGLIPTFGLYLLILLIGSFFLPGKFVWSEIYQNFILCILLGSFIGFIPLSVGMLVASSIAKRLIRNI